MSTMITARSNRSGVIDKIHTAPGMTNGFELRAPASNFIHILFHIVYYLPANAEPF